MLGRGASNTLVLRFRSQTRLQVGTDAAPDEQNLVGRLPGTHVTCSEVRVVT
jgi:hypothetical protein